MYKIHFYQDKNGYEPVRAYLERLNERNEKDSRINLNKIRDYIRILMIKGTNAGMPYVKHIDGDIWELRPLRNRVLFAGWHKGGFVLLHHFIKKSRKTPKKEIATAKRRFVDMLERSETE